MIVTKEIEIGELFNIFNITEQGEYVPPSSLKVKTPDGFKKVSAMIKTQPNPEWEVETKSGIKSCYTDFHRLEVPEKEDQVDYDRKWKFIKNLKQGDKIITENGIDEIDKVYFNEQYSQMFDLQVDDNHCFITDGLVSHNSLLLGCFAINAFTTGKKVLVYSFETGKARLAARYYTNIANKSKADLFNDEEGSKEKLKANFEMFEGDIIIKEYPANSVSSNDLLAHLNDLEMYNSWKPDLVVADYLLIMNTNDRRMDPSDSYKYYKTVTEELRNVAKSYSVPVLTAVQINREGMGEGGGSKAITTSKNIAESAGIFHTVDAFITINQTVKDKEKNKLMLYLEKNRNEEGHVKIQCNVDYQLMRITEAKDEVRS